MYRP
ncbi:hypothetical protein YPPY32_0614, partial [Yersinia pestis PY-32]